MFLFCVVANSPSQYYCEDRDGTRYDLGYNFRRTRDNALCNCTYDAQRSITTISCRSEIRRLYASGSEGLGEGAGDIESAPGEYHYIPGYAEESFRPIAASTCTFFLENYSLPKF